MRQDDHEKKCYFRSSDRVFKMNGSWFFATREGDRGPFRSQDRAVAEMKRFIIEQVELAAFQKEREKERQQKVESGKILRSAKLELLAIDDRPYRRPVQPIRDKRKVYI